MDATSYLALQTFDETALAQLHELQVEGEPSFVGGLISDYLVQVKDLGEKIRSLQLARDPHGLERAAHKLKSSSAVLGLAKLAAICFAIEDGARSGQETKDDVAALTAEAPKAIASLTTYLTKI